MDSERAIVLDNGSVEPVLTMLRMDDKVVKKKNNFLQKKVSSLCEAVLFQVSKLWTIFCCQKFTYKYSI